MAVSPLISTMREAALQAAQAALAEREKAGFEQACERKDGKSWVTPGDIAAQAVIEAKLKKALVQGSVAFLGEESAPSAQSATDYRWVVDPVDGTSNFIRGRDKSRYNGAARTAQPPLPDTEERQKKRWAVSIALQKHMPDLHEHYDTSAALIFCPDPESTSTHISGKMFWSEGDETRVTTVLNGKFETTGTLRFAHTQEPKEAYIGSFLNDFPEHRWNGTAPKGDVYNAIAKGCGDCKTVPIHSACVSMMDVLEGKGAAYAHDIHCVWDTAAARFLLDKAGIPVAEYATDKSDLHFTHRRLVTARKPDMFNALNETLKTHGQPYTSLFAANLPPAAQVKIAPRLSGARQL